MAVSPFTNDSISDNLVYKKAERVSRRCYLLIESLADNCNGGVILKNKNHTKKGEK
jgi:hypothetical protein